MIERTACGAWRELESKLRPFVARRVRTSADVDDVLQDVFLRMQRGLAELRDEDRFGPWVYRVARSAIVDYRRAFTRRSAREHAGTPLEGASSGSDVVEPGATDTGVNLGRLEVVAFEPSPFDLDEDGAAERELAAYVALFIAQLPSPYREALTLVELEGQTQKQAAELLGISLSGMKSRVQRGRVLLRQALEDCCNIILDARGQVLACERRPDGRLPDGCCS